MFGNIKEVTKSVTSQTRLSTRYFMGWCRRLRRLITSTRAQRLHIFQDIYKNNVWGENKAGRHFFSGYGSRGEAVEIYAERMAELLRGHVAELGASITVIDLGCGDFYVGSALMAKVPDLTYVGCDIVPDLIADNTKNYANEQISFRPLDIVKDPLPEGDVYLVRQVLQHLSNADIMTFLRRLRCKYLYVTEGYPKERIGPVNPDKATGAGVRFDRHTGRGRGVELDQPPYGFATREMFRASLPPNEVIVTHRVFLGEKHLPESDSEATSLIGEL